MTDSYVPENENDLHNDDDSEEEFQDENDEYFSLDKDQVKVEAQDSDSDEPLKPKSKRGPGRPRKNAKNVLHRPKRNYVKSGKPRKYARLKIKKVKIGSNFFPIFSPSESLFRKSPPPSPQKPVLKPNAGTATKISRRKIELTFTSEKCTWPGNATAPVAFYPSTPPMI